MATTATKQIRIVKNGGPITSDVYMAYYSAGTAATEDWCKGDILHLSATGKLARADGAEGSGVYGTATALDNDAPWDAAHKWFIALSDHDSSAEGKSVYVPVQEITADTVFEIQLAASSTTAPTQANVLLGVDGYGAYTSTTGVWGLDVDDASNGMFVVVAKSSDYSPFIAETGVAGTAGSGSMVYAKLVGNIIL